MSDRFTKFQRVLMFTIAVFLLVVLPLFTVMIVKNHGPGSSGNDLRSGTDASGSTNEDSLVSGLSGSNSGTNPSLPPDFSLTGRLATLDEMGPINSILISQFDELIAEKYFGRMHTGHAGNIKSASKSILSILTGIAIEQGYLKGVDQPIIDFFPEYPDIHSDSIKASITIEDLLTMRSGLGSTSGRNYGPWVTSNNWIRYVLNRPVTGVPGVDRTYSTGNTHLLSVAIARASNMSILAFANRYLFGPMDIRVGGWDRDPQGYFLGGNNMAMRPRDMIKIGQLMMNTGVYNGERLVSQEWIIRSVKPVTGRRSGLNNYGYLWFRRNAGDYQMVYAFGNGGQYIMILPELMTVIAVTTRNNTGEHTRSYRRQLMQTLDREIIPYLESEAREKGFMV